MGLAASQARLLLLTARKDDVESQLMSIANQKLSLSRQSAKISEEYSDSLNATKLTWKKDDGNTTDLTYDLLMHPNADTSNGQYILTSSASGAVLLDNEYMGTLGLGDSGAAGDLASKMNKTEFLEKTMKIDEKTAQAFVDKYGGGGTATSTKSFTTNYSDTSVITAAGLQGVYAANIDLSGVYNNKDYPTYKDSYSGDLNNILSRFSSKLDNLSQSLEKGLISTLKPSLGSNYTSEIKEACAFAEMATYNKFVYGTTDGSVGGSVKVNEARGSVDDTSGKQCENTNELTWCWWQKGHMFGSGSKYGTVQVDGSQLIDTYLTFFDQYCAQNFGGTSSGTVGTDKTTRGSTGGTGSSTATTDAPTSTTGDINNNNLADAYEAKFYLNLYNAINSFGWKAYSAADDKSTLQNQILYGNINIKKYEDGNWVNLSTSDSGTPLGSESDEAAITKAEAKYNAEKDEIDAKEASLDLKMNDLDTERSAVTTEVESVQKIIDKNIESSFKMFQA